MVWDDNQGAPGFELPPYYAQRVDTVRPATGISVRRRATPSETEAQTERLFRDFKLGLVTLVVVALLLVAYFWDGEPERITRTREAEEAVLSIRLEGRRRSDVAMAATRAPVARPIYSTPAPARRPAAPAPAAREMSPERTIAPRVHTVRKGETLSAIALRRYGNAAEWRVIFNSNRSRLRRPSDLRAGMRLVIPPLRSAARRSRMMGALARASPTRRE